KGARLRRRDESALFAAMLAIEGKVEEVLRPIVEQIVQPIEFEAFVREMPAAAHHTMEVVRVIGLERCQQVDDGVPAVASRRFEQIATEFAAGFTAAPAFKWFVVR